MKKFITIFLALLCASYLWGQNSAPKSSVFENKVEVNRTVFDFGDVLMSEEELETTFTIKNLSSEPMVILSVITSCGCTKSKWTKEPILSGKSGQVSAIYTIDQKEEGSFDKTLTVYVSSLKRPIVLRLRGEVHKKKQPLSETYLHRNGPIGFKESKHNLGNMIQGNSKSSEFMVANFGDSPAHISFKNTDPLLSVSVSPNPIPVGSTSKIMVSVKSDRSKWGKNCYKTSLFCNNKELSPLSFWAFTIENFSSYCAEDYKQAPSTLIKETNYNYNIVEAGTKILAEFNIRNIGNSDLVIYKVDCDNSKAKLSGPVPVIKPDETKPLLISFDTTGEPKGENLVMITLVTNNPAKPYINLFITGAIK